MLPRRARPINPPEVSFRAVGCVAYATHAVGGNSNNACAPRAHTLHMRATLVAAISADLDPRYPSEQGGAEEMQNSGTEEEIARKID